MAFVLPPIQQRRSLITRLAAPLNLDPRAVLSVAAGEGLSGGIGDLAGGGSYGPFQLYAQGALPAQYRGRPQAAQQWAWSPAGIRYALGRMVASGAAGQTGARAIETIIRKFERPADPDTSVRNAIARYGSTQVPSFNGATPSVGIPRMNGLGSTAVSPRAPMVDPARNLILQGLASGMRMEQIIPQIAAARSAAGTAASPNVFGTPPAAPRAAPVTPGQPNRFAPPVELFYDPVGGIKRGQSIGPIGGHDTHLHYAAQSRQNMLRAIGLAKNLGLAVRENPYVDPVERVHTGTSWHYQNFPGLVRGRPVGRAADISGDAAALRRLYTLLAGRR